MAEQVVLQGVRINQRRINRIGDNGTLGPKVSLRRLRYSVRMQPHFPRLVLLFTLPATLALVTACDGTTGGYPPAPPAYEAPPAAIAAGKSPRFQPLVAALLGQRNAAKALAAAGASGADSAKYQELFAQARAASKVVSEVVAQAQLTAEEKTKWDAITSLDDTGLAALSK
jgi:hypothetical protein